MMRLFHPFCFYTATVFHLIVYWELLSKSTNRKEWICMIIFDDYVVFLYVGIF